MFSCYIEIIAVIDPLVSRHKVEGRMNDMEWQWKKSHWVTSG